MAQVSGDLTANTGSLLHARGRAMMKGDIGSPNVPRLVRRRLVVLGVSMLDLLAMAIVILINHYRVHADRPPTVMPSVGAIAAFYLVLLAVVSVLWRVLDSAARRGRLFVTFVVVFCAVRGLVVANELAGVETKLDLVSRQRLENNANRIREYRRIHGFFPERLADVEGIQRDGWGYSFGYYRNESGFRLHVRGRNPAFEEANQSER